MAKNASNSWVGNTMQPQFQTYQTAGMLMPQTPVTPPAVAPTTPTAPATGGSGSGSVFTPPPVGAPAFPAPITTQPQTTTPVQQQPSAPTTGIIERDRLIDAMLNTHFMEQ